jgi:hypothetical protein
MVESGVMVIDENGVAGAIDILKEADTEQSWKKGMYTTKTCILN